MSHKEIFKKIIDNVQCETSNPVDPLHTLCYIAGLAEAGLLSSDDALVEEPAIGKKDGRKIELTADQAHNIIIAIGMVKKFFCYPGAGVHLKITEDDLTRQLDNLVDSRADQNE